MPSSVPRQRRGAWLRLAAISAVWLTWTIVPFAQAKPYTPKNGVLNWKAILLGGAFRVSTAIPLHGDFSKYGRLEIVQTESLIGSDIPAQELEKLTLGLVAEFRRGQRFSEIAIVKTFSLPSHPQVPPAAIDSFRDADPIDAPLRTWEDLVMFDRQRQAAATASAGVSNETLVVRCQVIDYAKGNKLLQFLYLDLGNSVLTLRFSYYDKPSGEELGRSVISSNNSSKVIPSAFSARTELTGVIEGLVDQVTRRKIAGER